jgi:hypothetical protein
MPPPLASNPHRFHEDRSEIAHDIAQLARIIAPRRVRRSVAVEVSAERSGRAIKQVRSSTGSASKSSAVGHSQFTSDEGKRRPFCAHAQHDVTKMGDFRG